MVETIHEVSEFPMDASPVPGRIDMIQLGGEIGETSDYVLEDEPSLLLQRTQVRKCTQKAMLYSINFRYK